jgi:hypothetical protein
MDPDFCESIARALDEAEARGAVKFMDDESKFYPPHWGRCIRHLAEKAKQKAKSLSHPEDATPTDERKR